MFAEIVKGAEAEGKEKHVPYLEAGGRKSGGSRVKIVVGKEVGHPNTREHHIAWVELYGEKKDGQVIALGRAEFAPGYSGPNARFHLDITQFRAFHALAYCNVHGLWQNRIEVK